MMGEHTYIIIKTHRFTVETINFYLNNEDERIRITENAKKKSCAGRKN